MTTTELSPVAQAQLDTTDMVPIDADLLDRVLEPYSYKGCRYLLDADTMTRAREIRAGVTLKSCTADPDALAGLATQQEAIRAVLPASPNERLVYQCQKAAASAAAPAP